MPAPLAKTAYGIAAKVTETLMRGDFAATDPFLALMEDWFPRGVFGKHPHRGIETVTYVVEGRIDHYDNRGHEGTILPGDVQWMTAGVTVHSLQL
jgi:redox-sensitive bicupin YhaK (pirin superfamily)